MATADFKRQIIINAFNNIVPGDLMLITQSAEVRDSAHQMELAEHKDDPEIERRSEIPDEAALRCLSRAVSDAVFMAGKTSADIDENAFLEEFVMSYWKEEDFIDVDTGRIREAIRDIDRFLAPEDAQQLSSNCVTRAMRELLAKSLDN